MSTVKILYRQPAALPYLLNVAFLSWGNYEAWRIYRGTHPAISVQLEKAGLYRARNPNRLFVTEKTENKAEEKRTEPEGPMGRLVQAGWNRIHEGRWVQEGWNLMNGVPIPSLETLIRPFRKD